MTLVMLFDFRKSLDIIKHESVLIALRKLGFSGPALQVVHSYFTGRTQADVGENGTTSDYLETSFGFAQGSFPGPVFFLVLINELPNALFFCKLSYVFFADDLQLYIQCPPNMLDAAILHMSAESNLVSDDWATRHAHGVNIALT